MITNKRCADRKIIRTELLTQRLPIYHDKEDLDDALCIPPLIVPKMFSYLIENKVNIFEPKEMYRILKKKFDDGLILRTAAVGLYGMIRYISHIHNAFSAITTFLIPPKWSESMLVERIEDNLIMLYEQSIENGTIDISVPLCTFALRICYSLRISLEALVDQLEALMGEEMLKEIGISIRNTLDPKHKDEEVEKEKIEEILEDFFDEMKEGNEEKTGDKITDFIRFAPTE